MKITPLHTPDPTFLKLTKFEWVLTIYGGVLLPLFFQAVLRIVGLPTHLPILVCLPLAFAFVLIMYLCKDKEQDFLMTYVGNRLISNTLEGAYTAKAQAVREGTHG